MLVYDKHTYRVTWSEEDSEHLGLCVEFPSLSWLAATPEEARAGIRAVVAEVVNELQKMMLPGARRGSCSNFNNG